MSADTVLPHWKEFAIITAVVTSSSIRPYLHQCGYDASLIDDDRVFTDVGQERSVKWAAFSQRPHDARSACLAAIDIKNPNDALAMQYRHLGAPTLFACTGRELRWYGHDSFGTKYIDTIPARDVPEFFARHSNEFSPQRIYRAKTTAKFDFSCQLSFVDAGLMPLLEQDSGQWLGQQVESLVSTVQKARTVSDRSPADSRYVFQSVFWLLAARLLKDKGVKDFRAIDMTDLDLVFERVAKHYGANSPPTRTPTARNGMLAAAEQVKAFPSLANVTTETLAYLHENTLVSKEIRKAFGTHSTPQWLVDYIVWQLTPWIKSMAPDDRHVLEPGCGHAPFLVAALRVLQQDAPGQLNDKQRARWLREHVRGMEVDDFAREIGRLSLTIADVPNPNGWTLTPGDMFKGPELSHAIKHATILLSNPPFEDFKKAERETYNKSRKLSEIRFNKASELFSQIIEYLPANGVFGLVMPKNILTSRNSRSVRERLTREFELHDICMLPDRVFEAANDESVVLLGRRKVPSGLHSVSVRRVRPWDLNAFRTRLEASSEISVPQASFLQHKDVSFRVPDLQDVWEALRDNARLGESALVRQGFQFKNKKKLGDLQVVFDKDGPGRTRAYLKADSDYPIYGEPEAKWIVYKKSTLRRPGADFVSRIKQVVVNYAGPEVPWCRRATIDNEGCAVSSRFVIFRPNKPETLPLNVLWAILNSPVANAYAHSYSTKWQTLPKEWRAFPLPTLDAESVAEIEAAASAYEAAVDPRAGGRFKLVSEADIHQRLIEMDAAVLKAYALPPGLEQKMLAIFDDIERPGVGCRFTSYPKVPTTVHLPFHLRIFLPRFHELSALRRAGKIKRDQRAELEQIKARFDAYEREHSPSSGYRNWLRQLDQEHESAMAELLAMKATIAKRNMRGPS